MSVLIPPATPALIRPHTVYPESDGQPMGETDFHISVILYLRQALQYVLRDDDQAYVAANMMFYYERGVAASVKAPDVFVVKGIDRRSRRVYKLWVERVAPCTIIEVTSRGTWLEDMGSKRALYEAIGVSEYFVFDPVEEYLRPRFQGFQLVGGRYEPMPLQSDGSLTSKALGVTLRPAGDALRVVDPATGAVVPTLVESMYLAQVEAERAEAAEAEAALLRAELEKYRRQS